MTSLWITRTQPGADRLAQALVSVPLELLVQPLIHIEKISAWDSSGRESKPRLVIVTSQHAAQQYLASEIFASGAGLSHIVLGDATAELLRGKQVQVILPEHQSSEGILALTALTELAKSSTVWIIGGEGGREVLQDVLAKRGFKTVKFESYRRVPATTAPLTQVPDLIEIASLESLKLAVAQLPHFDQTKFIVASKRLADAAQELGVSDIEVAQGADVKLMQDAILKIAGQQP